MRLSNVKAHGYFLPEMRRSYLVRNPYGVPVILKLNFLTLSPSLLSTLS